jgi:hypothetical protein
MVMSREARKLLTELEALAIQNNTSTLVTQSQVYVADQVILKYYTAPILNAIKSKVKGLKNKSSKHFTIEHWVSVLDSMFLSNMGVRREGSVVQVVDAYDIGYEGFQHIIKYLVTDYSISDAEMIYKVVHMYEPNHIRDAIRVAINNKVYNIQYINAILEREQALSNMKKQEIQKLRDRADNASSILNKHKVSHSVIDVATSQYNWEQQKQNAELEQRMKEIFGE